MPNPKIVGGLYYIVIIHLGHSLSSYMSTIIYLSSTLLSMPLNATTKGPILTKFSWPLNLIVVIEMLKSKLCFWTLWQVLWWLCSILCFFMSFLSSILCDHQFFLMATTIWPKWQRRVVIILFKMHQRLKFAL